MLQKVSVISAKCVGGYNDTLVYNATVNVNGTNEIFTIERHSNDMQEPSETWEISSKNDFSEDEKKQIIDVISKNPPSIFSDVPSKIYNEELEDSIQETITSIANLDDEHSYTVARVIEGDKCVELHYNNGNAEIEYGTKESEDMWENEINDNVEWFNLDLTDDEILENLNKEFDNYFAEIENEETLEI